MEILSRGVAKALGFKRYFTGTPCKRGHIAERLVSTKTCIPCLRAHVAAWEQLNPEKLRAKWRRQDPHKKNAQRRARYAVNPERFKVQIRKWEAANQHKVRPAANARFARRRAAQMHATPSWLSAEDRDLIRFLYDEAAALSRSTGIQFHVDHIVPLRGKTIYGRASGLHVPWNLQIISAFKNRSKMNVLRDESEFLAA